jgi:hypothetical protein
MSPARGTFSPALPPTLHDRSGQGVATQKRLRAKLQPSRSRGSPTSSERCCSIQPSAVRIPPPGKQACSVAHRNLAPAEWIELRQRLSITPRGDRHVIPPRHSQAPLEVDGTPRWGRFPHSDFRVRPEWRIASCVARFRCDTRKQ